ncbi:MAG: PAS domain-containing protein [Prevotellaceae bacterium]|jgi:transcriptional regulator with PAS, ATPase and Fis domain|nr:PAS domain-containing protein [Prevotellaceae bacterium]
MNYFDELDCAVTVCDTQGTVIYCNEKSKQTFAKYGDLIGKNLNDCHSPVSWEKILHLLKTNASNAYTIEKNGQKKLIYQTPWLENGDVKGLIEFSFVFPS